jgi:hypothetical protein
VSFLAPDGEEIRNKRQLDKYLKKHPGSLTVSDFDWSSGILSLLFPFCSFSGFVEVLGIASAFHFLLLSAFVFLL